MIKGDQVAVYQDTYLELIENDSTNNSKMQTNQLDDSIQNLSLLGLRTTAKADKKKSFNVNRPFVFIFEISHCELISDLKQEKCSQNLRKMNNLIFKYNSAIL